MLDEFEGMNVNFQDGHGLWRDNGEAGPRVKQEFPYRCGFRLHPMVLR
jgi:hypothetical protein